MKKGFTLVELLATITILGIIALLLVPTVTGVISNFRNDSSENQKKSIVAAAKLWGSDHRLELPTTEGETMCVSVAELKNGYLEDDIVDPDTKEAISDHVGVEIKRVGKSYEYTYTDSCSTSDQDSELDITDDVVTSGDGLYEDSYENGRYVYKGNNPNNYIEFNGELWRIIAKETDGTYKIIRDQLSENRAFDEANYRTTANNTFCDSSYSGCNVYGKVNGIFRLMSGQKMGTVTEDSSLSKYLNETYYNTLTSDAKNQVQTHAFNIGVVLVYGGGNQNNSIYSDLNGEKAFQWTGNIGLPNVTDILRANFDSRCNSAGAASGTLEQNLCISNYLVNNMSEISFWTMNGYSTQTYATSGAVWVPYRSVNGISFSVQAPSYSGGVRPVLFLKSTIKITGGNGSQSSPYMIEV